jgi:hypothetical protein
MTHILLIGRMIKLWSFSLKFRPLLWSIFGCGGRVSRGGDRFWKFQYARNALLDVIFLEVYVRTTI